MSQPLSSTPPAGPGRPPWRRPLRRLVYNWRERHQNPFNFWVHMIGIPLAVVGVVFLCLQYWIAGAICFVGGYLLQYIGHRAEGNDVGEWAALKRMLGLPYVSIAPRPQESSPR